MEKLYNLGPFYHKKVNSYPDPNQWCDLVLSDTKYITKDERLRLLKCPAASEGKSNYAMNPNCGPNSPGDMVLLFETKAGWNQHGGPELFTFDNHDPKGNAPVVLSQRDSRGGCVLLNDGTVKFIRTEAELHALRWKLAP
jgi:hypothetical protein